eukprot:1194433-Prorocentrum_minimum.AAC.5
MVARTASTALHVLHSCPRCTPATTGRTAVFPHTTATRRGCLEYLGGELSSPPRYNRSLRERTAAVWASTWVCTKRHRVSTVAITDMTSLADSARSSSDSHATRSARIDALRRSRIGSRIALTTLCGRLRKGNRSWNLGRRHAASCRSRAFRMACSGSVHSGSSISVNVRLVSWMTSWSMQVGLVKKSHNLGSVPRSASNTS